MPSKGSRQDDCRCEVFAPLPTACSVHAVMNEFLENGGGNQDRFPSTTIIMAIKMKLFLP